MLVLTAPWHERDARALLLAGICRLGFIAQFLSRPVVEGFVFGLAIFVTVKQLPKLFGIPGGEGDTFRQLGHVITHLGDTNGPTLVIGAAALVLLFGLERFAGTCRAASSRSWWGS